MTTGDLEKTGQEERDEGAHTPLHPGVVLERRFTCREPRQPFCTLSNNTHVDLLIDSDTVPSRGLGMVSFDTAFSTPAAAIIVASGTGGLLQKVDIVDMWMAHRAAIKPPSCSGWGIARCVAIYSRASIAACTLSAGPSMQKETSSGPTPTVTPIPEPESRTITAVQNTTCRSGADVVFEEEGDLVEGESVLILGKNPAETWWWIEDPV